MTTEASTKEDLTSTRSVKSMPNLRQRKNGPYQWRQSSCRSLTNNNVASVLPGARIEPRLVEADEIESIDLEVDSEPGIAEEWDSTWESLFTMDDDTIYTNLTKRDNVQFIFEGMPGPHNEEGTFNLSSAISHLNHCASANGMNKEELIQMVELLMAQNMNADAKPEAQREIQVAPQQAEIQQYQPQRHLGGEIQSARGMGRPQQQPADHNAYPVAVPPWKKKNQAAKAGTNVQKFQAQPSKMQAQPSKPSHQNMRVVSLAPQVKQVEAPLRDPRRNEKPQAIPSCGQHSTPARGLKSSIKAASSSSKRTRNIPKPIAPPPAPAPAPAQHQQQQQQQQQQQHQEERKKKWFHFWLLTKKIKGAFQPKRNTKSNNKPKKMIQDRVFYQSRTKPGQFLGAASPQDRVARANAKWSRSHQLTSMAMEPSSEQTLDEATSYSYSETSSGSIIARGSPGSVNGLGVVHEGGNSIDC